MKRLTILAAILIAITCVCANCQSFPDKWDEIYVARRDNCQDCWLAAQAMKEIWPEAEIVVYRDIYGRRHVFIEYKGELYDTSMNVGDTATVLASPEGRENEEWNAEERR